MKTIINKFFIFSVLLLGVTACSKNFPVDEDGLLITTRQDCYVSNFELLGTDQQTIRVGNSYIDTVAQVAIAYVRFGSDVTNVWPQVSLVEDAKLSPKIPTFDGWTDFSGSKMSVDFIEGDWEGGNATDQLSERIVSNPSAFPPTAKKYTVIAGNREIRKEYTFLIVERPLEQP